METSSDICDMVWCSDAHTVAVASGANVFFFHPNTFELLCSVDVTEDVREHLQGT